MVLMKSGTDVVSSHGCSSGSMPHSVECLLEVYNDVVQILLMLQMSFTEDSKAEDLFTGAVSYCEPSKDFFCLCPYSLLRRTFNMTMLGLLIVQ